MYGYPQQQQSDNNTWTIVLIVCILWSCSILFSFVFCSTSVMAGVNKKKASLSNIYSQALKDTKDTDSNLATMISSS